MAPIGRLPKSPKEVSFSIAIQPFREFLPSHSGVEEETEGETRQLVRSTRQMGLWGRICRYGGGRGLSSKMRVDRAERGKEGVLVTGSQVIKMMMSGG